MRYAAIMPLLVAFLLIAGCRQGVISEQAKMKSGETVGFTTQEGFAIKGTYYDSNSTKAILLLHMLGRDRHDYDEFAGQLQAEGFSVLSIDLRGHGESTLKNGMTTRYTSFSEKDFNDMAHDVAAAKGLLAGKGKKMDAIIGASIGANIALKYAVGDETVKTVVLLSPGENYRGVSTTDAAEQLKIPAYIVASTGDSYSADSSKKLISLLPGKKDLALLKGNNHGTDMLDSELNRKIMNWIVTFK